MSIGATLARQRAPPQGGKSRVNLVEPVQKTQKAPGGAVVENT
jgi:hypothetical protein